NTYTLLSFFFTDQPASEIYTLSLHDALPIYRVVMRVAHQFTSRSPRLAGTRNPIRRISSENFGSPRSRSNSGSELSSIRSGSPRSEEHTSELQSPCNLVCRLLLEKKNSQY